MWRATTSAAAPTLPPSTARSRRCTEFPQAPANEEALSIMVASYEQLGLDQLRDDAERVLKKNFPNSRYLRRRRAASAKGLVAVLVSGRSVS